MAKVCDILSSDISSIAKCFLSNPTAKNSRIQTISNIAKKHFSQIASLYLMIRSKVNSHLITDDLQIHL